MIVKQKEYVNARRIKLLNSEYETTLFVYGTMESRVAKRTILVLVRRPPPAKRARRLWGREC